MAAQLKDIASSLIELWNLMDTPEEEMKPFDRITDILGSSESDMKDPGILSVEIIKQVSLTAILHIFSFFIEFLTFFMSYSFFFK